MGFVLVGQGPAPGLEPGTRTPIPGSGSRVRVPAVERAARSSDRQGALRWRRPFLTRNAALGACGDPDPTPGAPTAGTGGERPTGAGGGLTGPGGEAGDEG